MSSDICYLAARAYRDGQDPITYAEQAVTLAIEANQLVNTHRLDNPGAFPGYGPDATIPALARRILGALLDAGWTPPALDGQAVTQ